ncbi:DUF1428 domain-containing protein [Sphingomonas naphthae]|uniref:DUF1428 domain-containing protein n=1 Tax=Sphingomonas naphthae TaxID=1813468 RepID=A0ABY7TKX3_9SPHN|nr:DUF1428 domain-containing protein [Sphingomonas naphthae]WCT73362.1 DUF1428 domain-containing protein [Sphingomonas naphthae]
MSYVEGFVIPVPEGKKEAYRAMAEMAAPIFIEHGATRVVETWGDDVKKGHTTDFYGGVKAEEGEVIVFSWIEYPSKEARDAAHDKVMADPRMKPPEGGMPFDGKRMVYGGFAVMVDQSA